MNEHTLPELGVTSGLVVSPGDVLVLTLGELTKARAHDVLEALAEHVPGVYVVLLPGEIRMAVMKPLELVARGTCERCGEPTDTPPECRDCAVRADVAAAKAWREGRE